MNLFKKNKETVKESKSPMDAESSVVEAPVEQTKTEKPDLNDQEKELKTLIGEYKKYSEMFSPVDLANMPDTLIKAEDFGLKFAIFAELNRLNRNIEDLK